MRMLFTATLAALGFTVAAALTAQEPAEVKPGPEHALFKEWAGTWDGAIKGPDNPKATSVYKVDLNGLWVLEHFKGEFGGKTFEGRGATGYDPAKKKYINVWISSNATTPMISEGTYDKATKTLSLTGNMPMPDGKNLKTSITIVFKDADTKTFSLKGGGPEGKEFDMVYIAFKRRAK